MKRSQPHGRIVSLSLFFFLFDRPLGVDQDLFGHWLGRDVVATISMR